MRKQVAAEYKNTHHAEPIHPPERLDRAANNEHPLALPSIPQSRRFERAAVGSNRPPKIRQQLCRRLPGLLWPSSAIARPGSL